MSITTSSVATSSVATSSVATPPIYSDFEELVADNVRGINEFDRLRTEFITIARKCLRSIIKRGATRDDLIPRLSLALDGMRAVRDETTDAEYRRLFIIYGRVSHYNQSDYVVALGALGNTRKYPRIHAWGCVVAPMHPARINVDAPLIHRGAQDYPPCNGIYGRFIDSNNSDYYAHRESLTVGITNITNITDADFDQPADEYYADWENQTADDTATAELDRFIGQ